MAQSTIYSFLLMAVGTNRGGFIYHYTSTDVRSILSSGLPRPRGVAFDKFTNLFVATNTLDSAGTFSAAIDRAFDRNSSGEKSTGLRWQGRAVERSRDDRWVWLIRLRGFSALARSKAGKRLHGENCAELFDI